MAGRRFYYGWLVVAAAFVSTGLAVGTGQYAFGVFVEPLETEFGWSRTQLNAALSLSAVAALSGPLIGRVMDRVGARSVMGCSLVVIAASYAFRPLMTQLWHWYVLNTVLALGFIGATDLPAGKLVGLWFRRTRGRMMGLATMGNNFGGLTMAPLAGLVVSVSGWRWGYGVFAILLFVAAPLIFVAVRDRPEGVQEGVEHLSGSKGGQGNPAKPLPASPALSGFTVGQALRTRALYFIILGTMASGFSYSAVLTQLIPHLEAEGVSLAKASLALSVLAGFGMAGKLLFGLLAERIPARFALMLSLSLQVAGLIMLSRWSNTPYLWAFMPFYGIAFGAVGALVPLVVQQAFGIRYFGSIQGLVGMARMLPVIVGPLMVGAFYDSAGNYRMAFLVVACIFVAGAVALSLARPPKPGASG